MSQTAYKHPNYKQDLDTSLPPILVQLIQDSGEPDFENLLTAGKLLRIIGIEHTPVTHSRLSWDGSREDQIISRSISLADVMRTLPHVAGESQRIMKAAEFLQKHGFLAVVHKAGPSGHSAVHFDVWRQYVLPPATV
jgi:hypothetical protein